MDFLDKETKKFEVTRSPSPTSLGAGQVVRFEYSGEIKNAIILVGDWQGKMHALSLLSDLSESKLKTLLLELQNTNDAVGLRNAYEKSPYTKTKSYRTYSPEKISQIKVVALPKKKSPPKKNKRSKGETE